MIIKIAELGQIVDLMEIENKCFSPSWSVQSMQDEINASDGIFLTAVEGIKTVGFCCIRVGLDEAELYQIAVDEKFRLQGVGRSLLNAAMKAAESAGPDRMLLEVRQSNIAALSIYRSLGFCELGRRKNYYEKPREDAIIMAAKLKTREN